MTSITTIAWLRLVPVGLLISSVGQAVPSSDTATITANVGPLRNDNGSLACRLYASAQGFPRTATGVGSQRVKIGGGTARCVFENVKPGAYAIVVHHDENDNHRFDKSLLGVPLEGYGASNNHTHALSPPTWQESKFVIESNEAIALAISIRY